MSRAWYVQAFPGKRQTLCSFLENQAETRAPAAVRRRIYALRKAHRLLGLPDPTRDEEINFAFRRVRRRKSFRPKQAKGITREYLDRFLETEPETPWGLRNRAMLSLGYELLTRRSELVALRTDDLEERGDGTLRVLVRRSKSDPFGLGRIAFTSERTAQLVRHWLDWQGPEIEWLFCPIYHREALNRDRSTRTVKRLIRIAARRVGLDAPNVDAFSGHSMRVGAAQDLLAQGLDTAAIMRAGGCKIGQRAGAIPGECGAQYLDFVAQAEQFNRDRQAHRHCNTALP